ncbi:hypothetical protein TNCV_1393771 [Trichonephila clavipes]|nr:hypothetical protein TNCV_1393771 [Trichonephila clavipes]
MRRYDYIVHMNTHKLSYHRFQNNINSLLKIGSHPSYPKWHTPECVGDILRNKQSLNYITGVYCQLKVPGFEIKRRHNCRMENVRY